MKRRTRILASLAALAAIAFAQFAIAVHACERMTAQRAAAVVEDHSCCPDADRSAQCAAHCDHGLASLDSTKPAPTPVTAVGAFLGTVAAPASLGAAASITYLVPPTAGPPPALRFVALRI